MAEHSYRYLSSASYNGPRVESYYEGDYYYEFNHKWDHELDYVYCDFKVHALYEQKNDRLHGYGYHETFDVYDVASGGYLTKQGIALVSDDNPDGVLLDNYALFYMGELENVEVLSGETLFHQEGKYDLALGAVDKDSIVIDNVTREIVNNGYRIGERETSFTYGFYDYGATISDPLWLRVSPNRSNYGKPRGIAYEVLDLFPIKTYQRGDGRYVSFSSIIKDETIASIKSDLHAADCPVYTSYPTGYYRVSYVLDVDLSLQTLPYGMMGDSGYQMILNPQSTELLIGYIGGSIRPVLSYSPSGDFTENHTNPIRFDIEDLTSFFGIPA